MPPIIRGVAWMVYLMTLGLLAWWGAQLAFRQVPPLDPALDGPLPPKTLVAEGVLPADYPLAIEQAPLRDYLFTIAAGKDASEYLKDGRVRLLGTPGAGLVKPPADGISAPPDRSIMVLKYDGDLVRWRLPDAAGPLWGPKKPLEKVVKANGKKGENAEAP
jgi:hypothetical protein